MSNIQTYNEIMAFHPGYYIAEIIEDMEITQAEFALRMGTTPKTLSQLLKGQANISNDLAQKLSTMLGTSAEFWLNLQVAYDSKVIEITKAKALASQVEMISLIDYSYFVKIANLPNTRSATDKVSNLCRYLQVSNLQVFMKPDFLVNFRTGISHTDDKNIFNARIWLQIALNIAHNMDIKPFNASCLKSALPEIRQMTLQAPEIFLPRLREIFSECGVAFVLLPYLKNSAINGAVKWLNQAQVVLAMNDRNLNADTFWFSLFHEIRHILQQKTKTVFINSTIEEMRNIDTHLEDDADTFARNYLIPEKNYHEFNPSKYTSDDEIISFAHKIGIHPGVVAGRMQHDGILPQNRCSKLKIKYKIDEQLRSNV